MAGVIQDHFASIEAMPTCGWNTFARNKNNREPEQKPIVCLDYAMTKQELTKSSAVAKKGEASAGLICRDLLSAAPSALSRVYHPLRTKSSLLGREHLKHKGGLVHDLWKKCGSQVCMSNYRSIM